MKILSINRRLECVVNIFDKSMIELMSQDTNQHDFRMTFNAFDMT